jgi:hypothetical protein
VQQVGIYREWGLAPFVHCNWDAMGVRKFQQLLPRHQIPFTPRGNHNDIWLQGIIAQLETDLKNNYIKITKFYFKHKKIFGNP